MTRRIGVAPQDCGDPKVTWLTARAVALLVILRGGPRSVSTLAKALGESGFTVEIHLIGEAEDLGLVGSNSVTGMVSLTDEGRDWIARSGCAL